MATKNAVCRRSKTDLLGLHLWADFVDTIKEILDDETKYYYDGCAVICRFAIQGCLLLHGKNDEKLSQHEVQYSSRQGAALYDESVSMERWF